MQPSRREFLQTTGIAAGVALMPAVGFARSHAPTAERVIFINLVGGPSQLDTWDPKPDAPSEIRGPFRSISTRVPGVRFSELFPKMAQIADRFSLVRTIHHDAPPIHECSMQIINTGRLGSDDHTSPNVAAIASYLLDKNDWLITPDQKLRCGLNTDLGFHGGWLGREARIDSSGWSGDFEQILNRITTSSDRFFTTINQFETVFDQPSWDCHAAGGSLACSLHDYQNTVAPQFDRAFSRLILNLEERGLLDSTLVVATGEFGRSPRLNNHGGRDHWANCWTALFAGGGVRGGCVVGKSDAIAGEPIDRPIHARDIPATVLHALGIGRGTTIPGPMNKPVPAVTGQPIEDLFTG